jgi:hypothetical protein
MSFQTMTQLYGKMLTLNRQKECLRKYWNHKEYLVLIMVVFKLACYFNMSITSLDDSIWPEVAVFFYWD